MNVTEGDNVTFDIAITFVDGGACGCNERVTLQRFFRGNNSTPQAFCRDIINDCPPGQSFVDPIVNVTMDDADMYILQVEVSQPRTSGTNCFLKFFNLIVNPGKCTCRITIYILRLFSPRGVGLDRSSMWLNYI